MSFLTNHPEIAIKFASSFLGSVATVLYRIRIYLEAHKSYTLVDGVMCIVVGTILGATLGQVVNIILGNASYLQTSTMGLAFIAGAIWPYVFEKTLNKIGKSDE